jgi:hypothetical protein
MEKQWAADDPSHESRNSRVPEVSFGLIDSRGVIGDDDRRESGIKSSRVLATLTALETKRMLRRLPSGSFMRTPY